MLLQYKKYSRVLLPQVSLNFTPDMPNLLEKVKRGLGLYNFLGLWPFSNNRFVHPDTVKTTVFIISLV